MLDVSQLRVGSLIKYGSSFIARIGFIDSMKHWKRYHWVVVETFNPSYKIDDIFIFFNDSGIWKDVTLVNQLNQLSSIKIEGEDYA